MDVPDCAGHRQHIRAEAVGKRSSLALALAKLLKDAGLPDGVFNVVQGDKESVDVLLTDPRVQAVSFVGSTPIAQYIYETASAHGKRCQALGGAKPLHLNAGCRYGYGDERDYGRCLRRGGRTLHGTVGGAGGGDNTADELCSRLEKQIAALRVGPGLHQTPENEMGPLISSAHRNKVLGYIDSGETQGARLRVDGRGFSVKGHEQGYFVDQRCSITSRRR